MKKILQTLSVATRTLSVLKYFVLISAASLIAANFALAANQSTNLQQSFEKIKEKVQGVEESTKNLIITKESSNLNPEEKEKQELNLRLDIFTKILDLSIKETKDVVSQLKALNNLEKDASPLQDQFTEEFEEFLKFYEEQRKILEKSEEIDLAKIKEMAQFFKDWRKNIYLPKFRTANNFLLIYQQKSALEMAESRFKKIFLDVEKLKKINFKGADGLKKLLDSAANSLKEARSFRQEAENEFWLIETPILIASSTASSTLIEDNSSSTASNATFTEPEITTLVEENASSTATSASVAATSTIPLIPIEDQFLSIKNLVGESLNKIKETYQIFIEMSNFVKKLLI